MGPPIPASDPAAPPSVAGRPSVAARNRRQVWLFALLTLLLTAAVVWGGRALLRNSQTLSFAVGAADGVEARFAAKLAAVLRANNSRLRLTIVPNADSDKALGQFERRQADLAILRTDEKIPTRARALAILDHDLLLVISPKGKKIASLAALRKTKIALIGSADDEGFLRKVLQSDGSDTTLKLQVAPAGALLQTLMTTSGFGAVAVVANASRIVKDRSYAQYARAAGGFTLNAIGEARTIARKLPGVSSETIETGALSSSPTIPDDDVDTVGLQWLLVVQSKVSSVAAGELARLIYENKSELALDDGFASKIEPAETDKDALIVAHPGAAEYINDETKSFVERYSEAAYLGLAALGIIGSLFAGLYAKVTRIAPEQAGGLVTDVLEIGEQANRAQSADELDALQDRLDTILRGAVIGLRDGNINHDGLATFQLGHDVVRDQIAARRQRLQREPPTDASS